MLPYFITIAIVLLFSYQADANRRIDVKNGRDVYFLSRRTKFRLLFAVAALIFTAGFRYNVGSDFMAYYKVDAIFKGNFLTSLKNLNEPGILVFRDIIGLFTRNGTAYIFAFSLFTVGISCAVLLRNSNNYMFTLLLYIFCGCWHGSFNGVRQYLAATVILMGVHFIQDRKLFQYALTVFIAFLFHKSAIFMIIPYFVMRNKVTLQNILLLAAGTLVVLANYDTLFEMIGGLKEKEVVMDTYATTSVNVLRVAANAAPAIAAIVINYKRKLTKKETFCINGLVINACAMIAASNSAYLARVGCYTGLFIPMCLTNVIRMKPKSHEQILRVGIVALYAIFWYVEVSTSPALNNFTWVFQQGM